MKSILSLFACLCMAGCAFGANPSFQSFDTNDFLILPSISTPNKIRLNGTLGITNIYATNITVNNLYATNIFTTNFFSFSTNVYVTNLTVVELTVVTNITIGGTNVAVINPTDLHYPYRASSNSFGDGAIIHIDANTAGVDEMDIGALVVTNLMTGGVVISDTSGILTNIPVGTGVLNNDGANNFSWGPAGTTINPTDGFTPYRVNGTTFGNSPWFRITTNAMSFNGTNQFIFAHPDYAYPNYGVLAIGYDSLASLSGAHPAARTVTLGERTGNLATSATESVIVGWESGAYATNILNSILIGSPNCDWSIEDSVLIGVNVSDGIRRSLYNTHIGFAAAANTINEITNTVVIGYQAGVTNSNEIVIGNANNTKFIAPITSWGGAGTKVLTDDGTYKAVSAAGGLAINPTDYYIPFRTNATTFLNSPLYVTSTNVALDSHLVFGPGTTNELYRSSSDLIYTNGLTSGIGPFLIVNDGSGNGASFGTRGAATTVGTSGSSTYVQLMDSSSRIVKWLGGRLLPGNTGYSLGGAGNEWFDLNLNGTEYIYGFLSGTNYSRLAASHSGTNGSAILNTEANGTAGAARPINVQVGGTNVMVYKADRQEFYNDGAKKWTMISGNLYPESANDIGTSLNPIGYLYAGGAQIGSCLILSGAGSPEGVKTAPVGSLYMRSDGGANTSLYVKESGSGNTGWVGK